MNKIVEFSKKKEQVNYEKIRDEYKKDFKNFVQKRKKGRENVFL